MLLLRLVLPQMLASVGLGASSTMWKQPECFTELLPSCCTLSGPSAAVAVLVGLAVDWLLGEPSYRLHPVVWMGNYLSATGNRIAPTKEEAGNVLGTAATARFICGAVAWIIGASMVAVLAAITQHVALTWLPRPVALLVIGVVLKPLFAWKMLADEVANVELALGRSLDEGRERLTHLVSRDPSKLKEHEVREAAIESLAENFNDSVTAPLFWFLLLGLPGAAVYRFANTADAMWGYPGWHGRRVERDWSWAGKFAARADDVLSWVTARLSAAAFIIDRPQLWARLGPEASVTASPNAGWPMAAMALYLGVRLGKPNTYVLNKGGVKPTPASTERALKRSYVVVWGMVGAAIGCIGWGLGQGAW